MRVSERPFLLAYVLARFHLKSPSYSSLITKSSSTWSADLLNLSVVSERTSRRFLLTSSTPYASHGTGTVAIAPVSGWRARV